MVEEGLVEALLKLKAEMEVLSSPVSDLRANSSEEDQRRDVFRWSTEAIMWTRGLDAKRLRTVLDRGERKGRASTLWITM